MTIHRLRTVSNCFVYVLENERGRLYIGHTSDIDRRLREHNDTAGHEHLGKYTHRNGPWHFLGAEKFETRSEANIRERQLKGWKSPTKIRQLFE